MKTFIIQRRVQLHKTDLGGLMHHPNYFNWMEAAEYELFEHLAEPVVGPLDEDMCGSGWPRSEVSMKFLKPLKFCDQVEIVLSVTRIRAASLSYRAEFYRIIHESRELVALGEYSTIHCLYDAKQKRDPKICPANLDFLKKLEDYCI